MEERSELSIFEKTMKSWTVMPKRFLELGHTVYISDPEYSELDPHSRVPQLKDLDVTTSMLHGRYRDYWMEDHLSEISYDSILLRGKSFFLFSVFRLSPSFMRELLYNDGVWYSATPDLVLREKIGDGSGKH